MKNRLLAILILGAALAAPYYGLKIGIEAIYARETEFAILAFGGTIAWVAGMFCFAFGVTNSGQWSDAGSRKSP